MHLAEFEQFQHRQEVGHDLFPRRRLREGVLKAHTLLLFDPLDQVQHAFLHRVAVPVDIPGCIVVAFRIVVQLGLSRPDPQERFLQAFKRQTGQFHLLGRQRILFRQLRENALRRLLEFLHALRGLPESLVFLQAADQFRFRIGFVVRFRRPWQHSPALDLQERGGHQQKIAGFIHIQIRRVPHDLQILIRDLAHEDIPDIDLRLADQC